MSIIRWQPFSEFDHATQERPFSSISKWGLDVAADIYEKDGALVASLALPGIDQEELEVSIENDQLIVSGRRQEEIESMDADYYSKEIRRGSFIRILALPRAVEPQKGSATYEKGMLTVTLPVKGDREGSAVRIPLA